MTKPNSTVDWERIEADYRAGILSLREIAANTAGANHVAIARRAKKEGWTRDLSARIQAKADELVAKSVVTESETKQRLVTDRTIVAKNAEEVASVRLSHRIDIRRARSLSMRFLSELESAQDDNSTLAARISTMKTAADTLKTLVSLEREAWGIQNSNEGETPQTITKLVREIVRPS